MDKYKDHCLDQLANIIYECIDEEKISSKEIYNYILNILDEKITYHQEKINKSQELFSAMKYNNSECNNSKSWVLPVEVFAGSEEYFVSFPDDLLKYTNLKEGDEIEWVDRGDGSYIFRKVEK